MVRTTGLAENHGMNRRLGPLTCFLTLAMLAALSSDALALARHKQIHHARKTETATKAGHHRHAALKKKGRHAAHSAAAARRKPAPSIDGPAQTAAASPLSGDLAAVKQAMDLARKAKTGEATVIEKTIGDPAARKLVEWFILRRQDAEAGFGRYAAFIADNPGWPSMRPLRRRAEARLWQERADAAAVRSFTGGQPASARGRLALARVLLAEGDRTGAQSQVREAWP
jgi:soluble lytic murein transglycosylase